MYLQAIQHDRSVFSSAAVSLDPVSIRRKRRWSSIDGGITVSMERFNQVAVSNDKKYANIGAGNRWVDVYKNIEKSGVSVVGGRVGRLYPYS
jgi:hypothetical protein